MDNNTLLPIINPEDIQAKANEYALKGAIECIKDYYSSYSSPFRKAITAALDEKGTSIHFELPDIIGVINDKLSGEIDAIANKAIAESFIPQVRNVLTREDPETAFSKILKELISAHSINSIEDCECEVEKDEQYGWLNVKINAEKKSYSFTLHEDYNSKKAGVERYKLCSLPYSRGEDQRKMTLCIDDARLEIPFSSDVLRDQFVSYCARLVISDTLIIMDTEEFEDDMFEDRCHC